MRSLFNYIIKPKGKRYNNTKDIDGKELIINSDNYQFKHVNKEAVIVALPMSIKTNLKVGDTIIVHHNVFRRWKDIRGIEQNSKGYFEEDKYFVQLDQIYLYKQNNQWKSINDYCFIKPIHAIDDFSIEKEEPLIGILKYAGDDLHALGLNENDLVGFIPNSEYEFVIDGERLYRVLSNHISIKYEYKENEEEYNPSWASSS